MSAFGAPEVNRRDHLPVVFAWAIALALASLAVLALLLSGPGATAGASFGPFAGYQWHGNVRSLQASWKVPMLEAGSPPRACAGTWIGAEAPGSNGPFIQIGTNEQLVTPHEARAWGVPRNYYFAFWSTTAMHFKAQSLFLVRPGDRITASLVLVGGRWKLAIRDQTSGRAAHFATHQETGSAFNEAQWIQEDVTDGKTHKLFPYPQLSTVAFSSLLVNSKRPSYAYLYSQWMSEDGVNWAPIPLRNDAFALTRASVSAAGARYLRIIGQVDAAGDKFSTQSASWTARTPRQRIAAELATAVAALRNGSRALRRASWPAPASQQVYSLAANLLTQISGDRAIASARPSRRAAVSSQAFPVYNGPDTYGHLIRRALHIPEITPQS
jgi:hypothetical protein